MRRVVRLSQLPSSLSPSQLNVYLDCEQKWFYSYAEGIKPHGGGQIYFDKGNYIHELLHHYYSFLQAGFKIGDSLIYDSMKDLFTGNLEHAFKLAEENEVDVDLNFYQAAHRVVMRYVEDYSPVIDVGITDLKIEEHFEVEVDGRNFHGFIDLLYQRDGKWYIRDAKTGKTNTFSYKKVRKLPQGLFYGALLYQLTGIVANFEILWLNSELPAKISEKTKIHELVTVSTHTEAVYRNFWEYLLQVNSKQKSLTPMRNLSSCASCAYDPICNAELRGLSTEVIMSGLYARKESDPISEKYSYKPTVPFKINFGTQ
jgi:hypothetical protein